MKFAAPIWTVLGALAATAAIPAAAQIVSAADPASLVEVMQAEGYRADLGEDRVGDPMITTGISGWDVRVYFYDCTDGRDCGSIQFSAGFDRENPMSLERALEWNAQRRFGSVYLDEEGDPYLQWDIVTEGGISADAFRTALSNFAAVIGEFGDYAFEDDDVDIDAPDEPGGSAIRL